MIFMSLCGLPASGKSTLSAQLGKTLNAKVYSCDTFFFVNKGEQISKVIEKFHEAMCTDLLNGHNVICDGTYTIERTRHELLDGIASVQCKKIIVVLTTPFEECLRRNAEREVKIPERHIYGMHRNYQPPTLDEGWDEIIYVKEDGSYEKHFTGD